MSLNANFRLFFHILISLVFCATLHAQELRIWTSVQGKTVNATFVRRHSTLVILKKANGKQIKIPYHRLSLVDQQWVTNATSLKPSPKKESKGNIPEDIKDMFGKELYNAQKKKVSTASLADKKIGIYFSAHWCPPCRQFTPKLVATYNELKEKNKPFEIVFISSDRSKKAMFKYMEETNMPWLAAKYNSNIATSLSSQFDVQGIPRLVIVNGKGKILSNSARGQITSLGAKAYKKW